MYCSYYGSFFPIVLNVKVSAHKLPNDSDEEEVWDSSMLPFENDPQFHKLPPYYQDEILNQREKNARKRLKAL